MKTTPNKSLLKLSLAAACAVQAFSAILPAQAQVLLGQTDFSTYNLGPLAGQTGSGPNNYLGGVWETAGSITTAEIISSSTPTGDRALEIFRSEPGAYARVELGATFTVLTAPTNSYYSVDFYKATADGAGSVAFESFSLGQEGFGLYLPSGTGLQLISGATYTASSAVIETDRWYRLEVNLTTSGIVNGRGTFDAYLSYEGGTGRELIAENLAYDLTSDLSKLVVRPYGNSGAASSIQVGQVFFGDSYTDFPVNPIPEPSVALLLFAVAGLGLAKPAYRRFKSQR